MTQAPPSKVILKSQVREAWSHQILFRKNLHGFLMYIRANDLENPKSNNHSSLRYEACDGFLVIWGCATIAVSLRASVMWHWKIALVAYLRNVSTHWLKHFQPLLSLDGLTFHTVILLIKSPPPGKAGEYFQSPEFAFWRISRVAEEIIGQTFKVGRFES